MLRLDLHTHTTWSDGRVRPDEVAAAGRRAGLELLGISDHFGTAKVHSVQPHDLPAYRRSVAALAGGGAGAMRIACAVELDGRTLLDGNEWLPLDGLRQLDYVLVEFVGQRPGRLPLGAVAQLAGRLGRPVGLAHCDLAREFEDRRPAELAAELAAAGIFVELNTAYFRPGETDPYFTHAAAILTALTAAGGRVSIGSDTHDQLTEVGAVEPARRLVLELGLRLFDGNGFRIADRPGSG